jgi:hypothetical protein
MIWWITRPQIDPTALIEPIRLVPLGRRHQVLVDRAIVIGDGFVDGETWFGHVR